MSTAIATSSRRHDVRPHTWERLALRTLRLLEERIEHRILTRAATRADRRRVERTHDDRRADAAARAHLGMLPE